MILEVPVENRKRKLKYTVRRDNCTAPDIKFTILVGPFMY
jgi:hypothetical protein